MECKFQVGDMVVCVNAAFYHSFHIAPLTENRIYTVRGLYPNPLHGDIGLWLEELVNPPNDYGPPCGHVEPSYHHTAFRAVRKTNIEALRALVLTPKVTT
jgi:hypothetical protein